MIKREDYRNGQTEQNFEGADRINAAVEQLLDLMMLKFIALVGDVNVAPVTRRKRRAARVGRPVATKRSGKRGPHNIPPEVYEQIERLGVGQHMVMNDVMGELGMSKSNLKARIGSWQCKRHERYPSFTSRYSIVRNNGDVVLTRVA